MIRTVRAQARHRPRAGLTAVALALAAFAGSPDDLVAQGRPGGGGETPSRRILRIGPRAGFDLLQEALVLGAHLSVPVDPWNRVAFSPSVDATFLSGLTEYQFNLDGAVYLDPRQSVYLGAGAAFRNTYYTDEAGEALDERETRTGYTLFGGINGARIGDLFLTQLEFRWSFVDDFEPRTLTLGFNYPVPLDF